MNSYERLMELYMSNEYFSKSIFMSVNFKLCHVYYLFMNDELTKRNFNNEFELLSLSYQDSGKELGFWDFGENEGHLLCKIEKMERNKVDGRKSDFVCNDTTGSHHLDFELMESSDDVETQDNRINVLSLLLKPFKSLKSTFMPETNWEPEQDFKKVISNFEKDMEVKFLKKSNLVALSRFLSKVFGFVEVSTNGKNSLELFQIDPSLLILTKNQRAQPIQQSNVSNSLRKMKGFMFNYPYWAKGMKLERKLYLQSPILQKMVSSSTLQLYTKTLWSLGAVINLLMMTTIKVEYYTLKAYNDIVDRFMSTLSWIITIESFFCLCIWFGYSYRINRARNIVLWQNFHPT